MVLAAYRRYDATVSTTCDGRQGAHRRQCLASGTGGTVVLERSESCAFLSSPNERRTRLVLVCSLRLQSLLKLEQSRSVQAGAAWAQPSSDDLYVRDHYCVPASPLLMNRRRLHKQSPDARIVARSTPATRAETDSELLQELRASLISEVVTGKIDVRGEMEGAGNEIAAA